MTRVQLKVKISKEHFLGLKIIGEKYGVSIDEVVEMAIERLFLSELGILLVPKDVINSSKGVVIVDESHSVRNITSLE